MIMENPRTEYKTLTDLERLLGDADDSDSLDRLLHAVDTALTIIKDRKLDIEKANFNDPNYYQKARGEV